MKIIDLLNKIANGEEVPTKIKYEDDIYIHIDNYCYYCDETHLILSDRIFAEQNRLNDKVEILDDEDEEKGLPEKIPFIEIEGKYTSKVSNIELAHKINEIIDYLEKQR